MDISLQAWFTAAKYVREFMGRTGKRGVRRTFQARSRRGGEAWGRCSIGRGMNTCGGHLGLTCLREMGQGEESYGNRVLEGPVCRILSSV